MDMELPFNFLVSFRKVFDIWENKRDTGTPSERERAQEVLEIFASIPELREPFSDYTLLDTYSREISQLLSPLFPEALQTNEIKACVIPFSEVFFNETVRFNQILRTEEGDNKFELRHFEDKDPYVSAASYLLKVFHHDFPNVSKPTIVDVTDRLTGTVRTFRGFINADFTEFHLTDNSPDLSSAQIKKLFDNAHDSALWKELIPPGSFEMHGFGLLTIFDVTHDDALSELKNGLIKGDALTSKESLQEIQTHLRRYFSIADLQIGLAIKSDDHFLPVNRGAFGPLVLEVVKSMSKDSIFCEGTYKAVFTERKYIAVSDVKAQNDRLNPMLDRLNNLGIESYIICPLQYEGTVIGFLELGSTQKNQLSSILESRMREIAPLFETALKRSLDEYYIRVDSIIKEKCTAIHPTVEWKFQEAANKLLDGNENGTKTEMEAILFKNVIPLYGQFDIRGSSRFRDMGIREDLGLQLKLARQVLSEAQVIMPYLFYEQLIFQIDQYLESLDRALLAGDETEIIGFLQNEIEPVFSQMSSEDSEMKLLVDSYQNRINEKLGRVYEGRRRYDETVQIINDQISVHLNRSQLKAQEMFKHYFEMYKTDGVEYNLYMGQSLVKDDTYHPMYLRNLRLWQLTSTLEVERIIREISSSFEVPLSIASLILVQDTAIDIRFRMDEKRFDVDGAYNVRYEILKKRIDKSRIKGTEERLTQPGKLAIVYSNEAERREYEDYLQFLMHHHLIMSEIEHLVLEDMDGASGLKAIRVSINYEHQSEDMKPSSSKDVRAHAGGYASR